MENRFCFVGEQYDSISQQYYLRARFYNPVIGRFTQEDTYRGDGLNLYAYCQNNPVYYVDPSGHEVCPGLLKRIVDAIDSRTATKDEYKRLSGYLKDKLNNGQMLTSAEMDAAEKLGISKKEGGTTFNGEIYYFRGTTEGYEGNASLQRIGITPASTDLLVSTIFATEAEQYGKGIVYIASSSDLNGVTISEGNVLSTLEKEVGIEMLPKDFGNKAGISISSECARNILKDMGYSLQSNIYGKEQLNSILKNTPRLDKIEIEKFVERAIGKN